MAFTGAAVIKKISDNIYRITGLSLGIGANGTIGLGENAAAAVKLLGTGWNRYETVGQHGGQVELDESVQCDVISADAAGTAVEDIAVVKTGDGPADFLLTLTNKDAAVSGALEIYVKFHT
jgi:hypothetical protein